MKLKAIIADDHAIIQEGLKGLLEKNGIKVVAVAENGRQAIDLAMEHEPHLIMMDISMPDMNGVEATAIIKSRLPDTKILALSIHSSKRQVDKMFEAGAVAYIIKKAAIEELMDAIETVKTGKYYLSPPLARRYLDSAGQLFSTGDEAPKFNDLSKKERHVLQLVAEGRKNRDIADKLGVTVKTIESHRRNLMKKLNIFSVAGLTKYAVKEGIVSLD